MKDLVTLDSNTAVDRDGNVFAFTGSKWVLYTKVCARTLAQMHLFDAKYTR